MIWFFERGPEVTRLETRFDNASDEYLVVIAWPNRAETTERFREFSTFNARVLALEQQLNSDHWTQMGPPQIIPDGWKGGP